MIEDVSLKLIRLNETELCGSIKRIHVDASMMT